MYGMYDRQDVVLMYGSIIHKHPIMLSIFGNMIWTSQTHMYTDSYMYADGVVRYSLHTFNLMFLGKFLKQRLVYFADGLQKRLP